MTLEHVERLHAAAWGIRPTSRPCTDPQVRSLIQDTRINTLTTPDNEQDQ